MFKLNKTQKLAAVSAGFVLSLTPFVGAAVANAATINTATWTQPSTTSVVVKYDIVMSDDGQSLRNCWKEVMYLDGTGARIGAYTNLPFGVTSQTYTVAKEVKAGGTYCDNLVDGVVWSLETTPTTPPVPSDPPTTPVPSDPPTTTPAPTPSVDKALQKAVAVATRNVRTIEREIVRTQRTIDRLDGQGIKFAGRLAEAKARLAVLQAALVDAQAKLDALQN